MFLNPSFYVEYFVFLSKYFFLEFLLIISIFLQVCKKGDIILKIAYFSSSYYHVLQHAH